jgi:hypothetical protein
MLETRNEKFVTIGEECEQGVATGLIGAAVPQDPGAGDRGGVPVEQIGRRGSGRVNNVDNAHGGPPVMTTAADPWIGAVKSRV